MNRLKIILSHISSVEILVLFLNPYCFSIFFRFPVVYAFVFGLRFRLFGRMS